MEEVKVPEQEKKKKHKKKKKKSTEVKGNDDLTQVQPVKSALRVEQDTKATNLAMLTMMRIEALQNRPE